MYNDKLCIRGVANMVILQAHMVLDTTVSVLQSLTLLILEKNSVIDG